MEDTPTPGILLALIPDSMMWDVFKIDEEGPLLPMWFAHSPLLVGFALLTYRFLDVTKKLITREWMDLHMADEAKEALEEAGIDSNVKMTDDEEEIKK